MRTGLKEIFRAWMVVVIVVGSLGSLLGSARASSEVVTSDQVQNSQITLSTVLYKDTGEIDARYDYYAILVTVDDRQNRGPDSVRVILWVPAYAEEIPANHQPQAGTSNEREFSFSFWGITIPIHVGGDVTEWSTGTSSTLSLQRSFHWYQHQGSIGWCPFDRGDVFVDYGQYVVGVRVPANAGLYVYASAELTWSTYWLCHDGDPSSSRLRWSYATHLAGGADGYRSTAIRGVADAPDSGGQVAMGSSQVAGIIGGLTGQGDTTQDTVDRYQKGVAGGYTLAVSLYVNGKNLDLCVESDPERCSRKAGAADEYVEYYNPYGKPTKYLNIRVEGIAGAAGQYELKYQILRR